MSASDPVAGSSSRNTAQQQRFANAFATLYDDNDEEVDEGDYDRGPFRSPPVPCDRSAGLRFPISLPKGFPHIMATNFNEQHNDANSTLSDGIATFIYWYDITTGKTGMMDKFFGRRGELILPGGSYLSGMGKFRINEYGFTTNREGLRDVLITRKYYRIVDVHPCITPFSIMPPTPINETNHKPESVMVMEAGKNKFSSILNELGNGPQQVHVACTVLVDWPKIQSRLRRPERRSQRSCCGAVVGIDF